MPGALLASAADLTCRPLSFCEEMMHRTIFAAMVLASALLTACSSEEKGANQQLFKAVSAPLEQAKDLDSQMQQGADPQRQRIDRETGQ
jgi:hypothetical protein